MRTPVSKTSLIILWVLILPAIVMLLLALIGAFI